MRADRRIARWHHITGAYARRVVRWDEWKLAAYAEYSHAVKQLISASTRLREQRTESTVGADFPGMQAAVEVALAAAESERTMKRESVLVLGNSVVIIRVSHIPVTGRRTSV